MLLKTLSIRTTQETLLVCYVSPLMVPLYEGNQDMMGSVLLP